MDYIRESEESALQLNAENFIHWLVGEGIVTQIQIDKNPSIIADMVSEWYDEFKEYQYDLYREHIANQNFIYE